MATYKKSILENATNTTKKPYEPCKLEITTFGEDVIMASLFWTNGIYDKTDGTFDWDLFGDSNG